MYNENIKREFIDYYLSNRDIAPTAVDNVFNSSEKYELLANNGDGKDICNFTKPEIEDFYMALNAKSKERLSMTNAILKEYKLWCIEDKGICYDTTPYFDFFTIDDFKKYISKNILMNKYIGEETLNSYIKEIQNPCDQLLLVLLYNGVKGKQLCEIINLNVNQIEGNTLHLFSGRDVEVDDSVIDLIYETNNTYIYYSYGERARKWEMTGDNVFKGTKGVRSDTIASVYHRYVSRIVTFQKMFDNPELAINRISISGMLNALLKGAKEENVDFKTYVLSESAKPILEKYEFNRYPTKVMKLFEEYLEYIK